MNKEPGQPRKHYTPCEFSAALAAYGISMNPKLVRERCGLPEGDPRRIRVNLHFPGRHYIPACELTRIINPHE